MTDGVKIDRLKIRVPAAAARRPERLATEVAHRIARGVTGLNGMRVQPIQLRVKAGAATGDALAQRIADAVHRSIRGSGGR